MTKRTLMLLIEITCYEQVGMETEGFAIYDAMMQLKNEVMSFSIYDVMKHNLDVIIIVDT